MASIQGGRLGRYFEQLCRIEQMCLRDIATKNEGRLGTGKLPPVGGVYAFWWVGDFALLRSSRCNRELILHGPGGRDVSLEIDDEWLGLEAGLPVPLYVGKTAAGLAKRVGQHLMLGSKRILPFGKGASKAKAPTTTCQLRAGVEHLFLSEPDTRALVLDNVGLSYVKLDGDEHAANRFYLEDLAIGLMHPAFNVDIER